MLCALEGSSPTIRGENNYKYYVWKAFQATTQAEKIYEVGPAAISWVWNPVNIRKMANTATNFIQGHQGKLFLIGWSRGAAACIQVALDLNRAGYSKKIDAMFLFDAVDQDGSTPDFLDFLPDNVINVYHAIATKKNRLDRRIFPTCGRTAAPSVHVEAKEFYTSHGGIAGSGSEGDAGSHDWMWGNLRNEGVL